MILFMMINSKYKLNHIYKQNTALTSPVTIRALSFAPLIHSVPKHATLNTVLSKRPRGSMPLTHFANSFWLSVLPQLLFYPTFQCARGIHASSIT